MKHSSTPAIILILFLGFAGGIAGCSKSPTISPGPDPINSYLDTAAYFIASFNGETLTSYGTKGIDSTRDPDIWFRADVSTNNNNGTIQSTLQIEVTAAGFNSIYTKEPWNLLLQQCGTSIAIRRNGDAIGSYREFVTPPLNNIDDLITGKRYYFDPSTVFTVTSIDDVWVQGTYIGNIINESNKITVAGTFKMKKYVR